LQFAGIGHESNQIYGNDESVKSSSKQTDPLKRDQSMSRKYSRYSGNWFNVRHIKKFFLKISGHQQRWPRPLPGAILIPPALLVVADLGNSDRLR
jgi:hypothetical protein